MNIKEIIGSVFSIAAKVILLTLAAMFIVKYAKEAYTLGYRVFTEPPVSMGEGRVIQVTIGEDYSVYEVGQKLEEAGLIRDAKVFFLQELASESHGKLKPGKFDLNTNMTAEEMIKVMAGVADEKVTDEEELLFSNDESDTGVDEMIELSQEEIDEMLEDTEADDGEDQ